MFCVNPGGARTLCSVTACVFLYFLLFASEVVRERSSNVLIYGPSSLILCRVLREPGAHVPRAAQDD